MNTPEAVLLTSHLPCHGSHGRTDLVRASGVLPAVCSGRFRWRGTAVLLGLAALGVIHASTVILRVPQHTALAGGYDPARVSRLVRTNWVRTVGWSISGIIVAMMVVQVVSS